MINNYEDIKVQLKNEFFGIDKQIDEIVDSFKTWLTIKDYQTKPLINNLWGLTGVGKSALLNRVIELLGLESKVVKIKFNSKTNFINELDTNNDNDCIFILDEFQHLRTINDEGSEMSKDEKSDTSIVWDLLDNGKVQIYDAYNSNIYNLREFGYYLNFLISENVKLEKGVLYHPNLHKFLFKLDICLDSEDEIRIFKDNNILRRVSDIIEDPSSNKQTLLTEKNSLNEKILTYLMPLSYDNLFISMKDKNIKYDFENKVVLQDYMEKLSIEELYLFINEILKAKRKPNIKDFSKSNIYVLGNIDEAYKGIAKDLNSDISADYFYKLTKKINIADIKKALLKRFRAEEIARLGSKHIIYPSLTKKAFEQIIDKELTNFNNIIKSKFSNIDIVSYSNNIKKLIYKEGVFPIQGTRCIFSVVNDVIIDKFASIIEYLLINDKVTNISFDVNNSNNVITISYFENNDIINKVNEETFKFETKVGNLRIENNKGKQAHRAVHEAGHAVISCCLENIVPEVIYSVVFNTNSGFNLYNKEDYYYERINNYMNRISGSLGGYAAEKLIFGEDNISSGSSSDLEKATSSISKLFKECGFNTNKLGYFINKDLISTLANNHYITDDIINASIEEKIKEALTKAIEILTEQKVLLLKLSEYLTKNTKISNNKIKQFVKLYAVNFDYNLLTTNKEQFYYDILMNNLNDLKK